MAEKGIDQHLNLGGNQLKNFILWLRTTAQALLGLTSTGMMAYDSDKDCITVKTSDNIKDVEWKQEQRNVSNGSFTVLSSDDRKLIIIENFGDVTINDLPDGFFCEFFNISGENCTFVAGTATVEFPDGYVLPDKKICTLFKNNDSGTFYLKGELTT